MSPVIESWLSVIEASLYVQRDGLDNYHVLMCGLQTIVASHGLERAIADVEAACPFHRVKAKVAHLPEKLQLFDMGVLGRAMCVNNIWQSSMHGDAHELGDQRAAPGSAWDVVTQAWKLVVTARPSRRMLRKAPPGERPKKRIGAPQAACPPAFAPMGGAADAALQPAVEEAAVAAEAALQPAVEEPVVAAACPLRPEPQDASVGESLEGDDFVCETEVAEAFPLRPETRDACVGESWWGDDFLWRTIFDMP